MDLNEIEDRLKAYWDVGERTNAEYLDEGSRARLPLLVAMIEVQKVRALQDIADRLAK